MVCGESKCLLSSLSSFQGRLMIASLYLLLRKELGCHLGFYGGAPAPPHLFCFLSTALVQCKVASVKELLAGWNNSYEVHFIFIILTVRHRNLGWVVILN